MRFQMELVVFSGVEVSRLNMKFKRISLGGLCTSAPSQREAVLYFFVI